jgi:hypothetical protein
MSTKVPALDMGMPIVNPNGSPNPQFARLWLETIKGLATAIDAVATAQAAATEAHAAATAAGNAAETATTAAGAANTAAASATNLANDAADANAIANSGTTGLTITSTDAGTSISVAISSHTRIYADGSSVAVTGATLTGLNYSTLYYFYYHDGAHTGGAVTYHPTTNVADTIQSGDVHSVGGVRTQAAAAPPVNGVGKLAPGLVDVV